MQFAPNNTEGYYNLDVVMSQQGKLEEAITAFREAIRLEPETYRM